MHASDTNDESETGSISTCLTELLRNLSSATSLELVPHAVAALSWTNQHSHHAYFRIENGHLGLCTCFFKCVLPKLRDRAFESSKNAVMFNSLFLVCEPAVHTLWNRRRDWLSAHVLNVDSEMHFSKLLLSRKPKCQEVFVYRQWILREFELLKHLTSFESELLLCDDCAVKYRCNYAAWDHRRYLIKLYSKHCSSSDLPPFDRLLDNELDASLTFLERHVSDISAWTYRFYLLVTFRHEIAAYVSQIGLIDEWLSTYPCGGACLWMFRGWLMRQVASLDKDVLEDLIRVFERQSSFNPSYLPEHAQHLNWLHTLC